MQQRSRPLAPSSVAFCFLPEPYIPEGPGLEKCIRGNKSGITFCSDKMF